MGVDAYTGLWIKFGIMAALFFWLIGWAVTFSFCAAHALGIHHGPRFYAFLFVVGLAAWPWMIGAEVKRVLIAIVERRR